MYNPDFKLGDYGEDLAADYLKSKGYKIVVQNYTNHFGEVDIIAKDRDVICFVEVKTRENDAYGSPLEAITPQKQRKIIQVAQQYLQDMNYEDREARFDVVGISLFPTDEPQINHIEDAFEI